MVDGLDQVGVALMIWLLGATGASADDHAALPSSFTCVGEMRDGAVTIAGTLAERGYDVVINVAPDVRADRPNLRRVASGESRRFAVTDVRGTEIVLVGISGRRTTLLELRFQPDAPSFVDDGTVFFGEPLICNFDSDKAAREGH